MLSWKSLFHRKFDISLWIPLLPCSVILFHWSVYNTFTILDLIFYKKILVCQNTKLLSFFAKWWNKFFKFFISNRILSYFLIQARFQFCFHLLLHLKMHLLLIRLKQERMCSWYLQNKEMVPFSYYFYACLFYANDYVKRQKSLDGAYA